MKRISILLAAFYFLQSVSAQDPQKNKVILTNPANKNILNVPVQLKAELTGFVDMHTHPMSHLGFGRKAMHGAPDVGAIVPAGTFNCNPAPFRATSIKEALGNCNSTHGGWGLDNGCGDYLRAGIINYALDDGFIHKSDNPHGDHHHDGYPAFNFWPHQSTILHQQMWWEWIKRAYDGGLRVMVALTVNSELLAELINGDGPYDDKTVADVQIDETIAMVNRHKDFMEIAYSAADLRRIVSSNKLAVVLGMEVDKIGNFGKSGVLTNEATVRAEIQRLYRKGIRYVFPIHLVDNSFGGTAVYSMLFNFANKHANGYHFRVTTSNDPQVRYSANLTDGPIGFENGLILGAHAFLMGLGQIPAPCFNDAIKCFPPPGKVLCCGSFERVLNIIKPSPELDVYKLIRSGHVNSLGLTRLGDVAINEMMKLGMIIDVDHMSEKSMTTVIETAEKVPGGYPLVMGHNELRGSNSNTQNERNAPLALVRRIANLGGMVGLGTSKATPDEFVQHYRAMWAAMGNKSVGIGTDVNGFEPLPRHLKPTDQATSNSFYARFLKESGITTRLKTGDKTWDYIKEKGVSHYGMMPEFFFDVKAYTGGADVINNLMKSAEHFSQMWLKCETASKSISGVPAGGTYTYNLEPVLNLCPYKLVAGDREFGGNGPRIQGNVTVKISPDGTSLQAVVNFVAKETGGDGSEVHGSWTVNIGEPAPAGMKYTRINGVIMSQFDRVLSGGGRNEVFEGCDGDEHTITPAAGPVSRILVVGDTGGGDISADANCHCDTRIVKIEFKPISVTIAPR